MRNLTLFTSTEVTMLRSSLVGQQVNDLAVITSAARVNCGGCEFNPCPGNFHMP